jgi:nitrite reductase/ring-hydroxylating ferredoxin subunit
MASYHPVCPAGELGPGRGRLVEIGGQPIALFNVDGAFFAVEDTCLHAGGPLHEGELSGCIVTCPWHEWQFDVTTGACSLNPKVLLARFAVRVVDGMIEIEA